MKYVMILIAGLFLAACDAIVSPFDDGYEFGDTTRSVMDLKDKYCAEADPERRAAILNLIRTYETDIPENGICTLVIDLEPNHGPVEPDE